MKKAIGILALVFCSVLGVRACAAESKTLVLYFSATGTTKGAAQVIANSAQADIYEIVPAVPYSRQDLNWNDRNSRSSTENANRSARPAIAGRLPDISGYDVICIGYPLWWGTVPRIVLTAVEQLDFSGKKVVLFSTAHSSQAGPDVTELKQLLRGASVTGGKTFRSAPPPAEVADWLRSLGL